MNDVVGGLEVGTDVADGPGQYQDHGRQQHGLVAVDRGGHGLVQGQDALGEGHDESHGQPAERGPEQHVERVGVAEDIGERGRGGGFSQRVPAVDVKTD